MTQRVVTRTGNFSYKDCGQWMVILMSCHVNINKYKLTYCRPPNFMGLPEVSGARTQCTWKSIFFVHIFVELVILSLYCCMLVRSGLRQLHSSATTGHYPSLSVKGVGLQLYWNTPAYQNRNTLGRISVLKNDRKYSEWTDCFTKIRLWHSSLLHTSASYITCCILFGFNCCWFFTDELNETNDDEQNDPEFNPMDELDETTLDKEEIRRDRAVNIPSMFFNF